MSRRIRPHTKLGALIISEVESLLSYMVMSIIRLDIADQVAASIAAFDPNADPTYAESVPINTDFDPDYVKYRDIDPNDHPDSDDHPDSIPQLSFPPSSFLPMNDPTVIRFYNMIYRGIDLDEYEFESEYESEWSEYKSEYQSFSDFMVQFQSLNYCNPILFKDFSIANILEISPKYDPSTLRSHDIFVSQHSEFIKKSLFVDIYSEFNSGRFKVWSLLISASLAVSPHSLLQINQSFDFVVATDPYFNFLVPLTASTADSTEFSQLEQLELVLNLVIAEPFKHVNLPFPDLATDLNNLSSCPFCCLLSNLMSERVSVILCKFLLLQINCCYYQKDELFHYLSSNHSKFIPFHIITFMACFGGRELSHQWLLIWFRYASRLHRTVNNDLGYACTLAPYDLHKAPVVDFQYDYFYSDNETFQQIRNGITSLSDQYSIFLKFFDLLHRKFLGGVLFNNDMKPMLLFQVIGDLATIFTALRNPQSTNENLLRGDLLAYVSFQDFVELFKQHACLINTTLSRVPIHQTVEFSSSFVDSNHSSSSSADPDSSNPQYVVPKRVRLSPSSSPSQSSSLLFSTPN